MEPKPEDKIFLISNPDR